MAGVGTFYKSFSLIVPSGTLAFFFSLSLLSSQSGMYLQASLLFPSIYNFSFRRSSGKSSDDASGRLPVISLVVLLVAVSAILIRGNPYGLLAGAPLNLHIFNNLNVSVLEVRPSLLSTGSIALSVMKSHIRLEVLGQSRFTEAWRLYRPAGIESTAFFGMRISAMALGSSRHFL